MTIDEAIQHAESNAAQHEKWSKQKYFENESWNEESKKEHILAAEEQRQFASWLTELKERRAADVKKVKRGRWKHVAGMNSKCSICSHYFPVSEFNSRPFDINFCPACGAKMDKE